MFIEKLPETNTLALFPLAISGKAEVDALFERRREMELAYMENKQKR